MTDEKGRPRSRIGTGLYALVVDELGQDIVDGTIPAGTLLYADDICEKLSVSRSVVREGVRTLGAMGLVEARPQVGTRVLPSSSWDLLNPQIVRWRAQGPEFQEQMEQLLELRLGLEPAAAGLAAERLTPEQAQEILDLAREMQAAYEERDARRFFAADSAFHRGLLSGTRNAVIAQMADTIGTTLDVRGLDSRPGMLNLTGHSVELHITVAQALVERDVPRAQQSAFELVEFTLEDFRSTQARLRDPRTPAHRG